MGRKRHVQEQIACCAVVIKRTLQHSEGYLETGINQLYSRHDVLHAVVDIAVSASLCGGQDFMQMLQDQRNLQHTAIKNTSMMRKQLCVSIK